MSSPQVSIIIPIYNSEKTISRTLDSIQRQSFSDFEIIAVNDGSSDATLDLLKTYRSQEQRLSIINQENQGVGMARNRGLEEASGDWVCFIDADDYIDDGLIAAFYDTAQAKNADCVVTNILFQSPKGIKLAYPFKPDKNIMSGNDAVKATFEILPFPSFSTNKFYRREIIEQKKIQFPPILYEDVYFVNVYFLECERVAFINKPKYHYLINPSSLTHSFTKKHCRDYITSVNLLRHYIAARGDWDYWQKYLSKYLERIVRQMLFSLVFMNKSMPIKERTEIYNLARKIAVELNKKPDLSEDPFKLFSEIINNRTDFACRSDIF